MDEDAGEQLVCLEVRGGNVPADVALQSPGLSVHVLSRPYHDAAGGGDIHYVSSCGTGRITRLMVADVAGHGVEVDSVAGVLQNLMRRYVNRVDARQFAQSMNDEFVHLTDAGVFATAVIATYFAPTRALSLINAGHPPPLLFRANTQEWSLIQDESVGAVNLPLGVLDRTDYEAVEVELGRGDAVVIYTDSLPESRDASGELLGYQRILELAQSLEHGQPLDEWINTWLNTIDAISPGNLRSDDLTVMLVRPIEGRIQATLVERVTGIGRMFVSPLRGRPFPWPEFDLRNLGGSLVPWLSRAGRRKP